MAKDVGLGYQLPALDSIPLTPAPAIKSLSVILLVSLSMKAQVINVAKPAFCHLCQVKQLTPYLFSPDFSTAVHAIVTSRLDYSNYVGLPSRLTWKLQQIQNAASYVLTEHPSEPTSNFRHRRIN